MSRPAVAYLSGQNLRHNITVIQAQTPHSKLIPMVKANAYGHGIVEVSQRIKDLVSHFGVASIEDAIMLRKADIQSGILLAQGPFEPEDITLAQKYDCDLVIHDLLHLQWLDTINHNTFQNRKLKTWIKVNTGMNRLGIRPDEVPAAYNFLKNHPGVDDHIPIMSHFACASQKKHPMNDQQTKCFQNLTNNFQTTFSFAGSGAIFNFPHVHYDYVRPGIATYGVASMEGVCADDLNLKPVMTLKSIVMAIRNVTKGEYIGYSAKYQAEKDMRMAVVAFGHADGYPVNVPEGTPILINGVRCPIIGPISMDMIIADVTHLQSVAIGDPVTIWGDGLSLDDIIPYTKQSAGSMLALLRPRVKYVWID